MAFGLSCGCRRSGGVWLLGLRAFIEIVVQFFLEILPYLLLFSLDYLLTLSILGVLRSDFLFSSAGTQLFS